MIYQYECPGDGSLIEIERKITDPEEDYVCGICGAKLIRIWTSPAIEFKGRGFYSTDK